MENYQALLQEIETCQACPLCQARTNVVPGDGNLQAKIMFIGEGPGAEEDKRGIPFVGAAGQLLDQMLDTIGLRREDVYIANIVKCRPPANRVPKPDRSCRLHGLFGTPNRNRRSQNHRFVGGNGAEPLVFQGYEDYQSAGPVV